MLIKLTSIHVDDQDKALAFYTKKLGFVVKQNFPAGAFKWITVASAEEPDGTELLLEPNDNPAAQAYMKALYDQSIAAASFAVEDVQAEYERLTGLGVTFTMEPTDMGGTVIAMFDDTCGNLIQIHQVTGE